MSEYRELEKIVSLLQQRVENLSAVITQINTQFIPKIHDRLAASERHVKKFDPMLERWENGYLVRTRVVRQRVEVPIVVDGGEKSDASKERTPQKRTPVDYAMYQEVMRLTEEGLGIHRISKALGISKQTVINIRKMPPERVEHLRRVHEGLPSIYKSSGKRAVTVINREELHKILEAQKSVPDISMVRLSAVTGVSVYRLKKYLALSDAEHKALLEALDEDE
ncbi:TPA: helix-turn-helix domain-containing protein [Escherichia coli]